MSSGSVLNPEEGAFLITDNGSNSHSFRSYFFFRGVFWYKMGLFLVFTTPIADHTLAVVLKAHMDQSRCPSSIETWWSNRCYGTGIPNSGSVVVPLQETQEATTPPFGQVLRKEAHYSCPKCVSLD